MIRKRKISSVAYVILAGALALTGCGVTIDKQQDYPEYGSDKSGREAKAGLEGGNETIFGELSLGGDANKRGQAGSSSTVNYFLWRATLETLDLRPLESADPFGGVIITDWYSPPETQAERFKVTVYILGRDLRADGVRAAVFRQNWDDAGTWIDAKVEQKTAIDLENAILTRARQLRIAGLQ